MSEKKQPAYTVVILIALAGVLLSLVAGCLGGAVAGYWAGTRAPKATVQIERPATPERPKAPIEPPRAAEPTPQMPEYLVPAGGALVQVVEPRTPAEEAGLQPGDIIIALDGTPLDLTNPLDRVLQRYEPGDTVELTVIRQGEKQVIDVTLGSHPDDRSRPFLGIRFTTIPGPFFHRGD